ncbi:MAG TPA: GNAT family N-acetyltransferase [Bacillota bacterium]
MLVLEMITAEDLPELQGLQPERWPSITEAFLFYTKNSFCHPVKAVSAGEILGVGAAISYTNTGWLAHIIVKEKHRRRGIGRAIVEGLCNYLTDLGHQTISLLATELGYPVYTKVGFEEETEYVILERPGQAGESAKNALSATFLAGIREEDWAEILSLDHRITGEAREALLLKYLKTGYVYRQDSKIAGFYLPELGEGLVIADNAAVGFELLRLRASFTKKGVFPIENKRAMDFTKRTALWRQDE